MSHLRYSGHKAFTKALGSFVVPGHCAYCDQSLIRPCLVEAVLYLISLYPYLTPVGAQSLPEESKSIVTPRRLQCQVKRWTQCLFIKRWYVTPLPPKTTAVNYYYAPLTISTNITTFPKKFPQFSASSSVYVSGLSRNFLLWSPTIFHHYYKCYFEPVKSSLHYHNKFPWDSFKYCFYS